MKIGVLGLGLIGGSIFKALTNKNDYEVIGVSSSVKEKNVSSDYKTLADCDLVFVCLPMSATLEVLDKLDSILTEKNIVTDVCSLKSFVSNKKYNFKFIPSHPMAGTENSGWSSSFPTLFEGAKWAITPIDNDILPEQDLLENIIKELGAEPIITTAEEHDKAVALISHMPMIVAQALCENIKDNKLAQELASSGFRDTTRLALSNLQMASDMVELNRQNIDEALELLASNLKNILSNNYVAKAKDIKEFRKNLY